MYKRITKRSAYEMVKTLNDVTTMQKLLASTVTKSEKQFKVGSYVTTMNKMNTIDYSYKLEMPIGHIDHPDFKPAYTPAEMLELGVFEGKYLNKHILELPKEWFITALKNGKLSPGKPNIECNRFKIKSRMSLLDWKKKGWIPIVKGDPDEFGWFEWYARYYLGRRIPNVDEKQIARWKAFKRHYMQVKKNCTSILCRPKQRQALLQWSYDAFVVAK